MPPRTVSVEPANPLDLPDWDARIAALPGATFFHGRTWARVLHDTYGFTPCYLVAAAGPTLAGVLPLMEVDSWWTGRRGVCLPFTDRCEPVGTSAEVTRTLFDAALEHAHHRGWRYCEVRGGRPAISGAASIAFYGHTLDLTPARPDLWQAMASSARRAARKAERSGIAVEFSRTAEALDCFHALHCRTRRRHGLPPQPPAFFDHIFRHVLAGGHGCVALARHAGRPVAAAVFFHFGRCAVFKYGASDEQVQHLRPNNLLMWRAIEWHAERGFQTLEFGRTSLVNEGLRRFKRSLGAAENRIEYVKFDCRRDAFVQSSDGATAWYTTVLKLFPGPLSRLLGSAAYKHVA